MQKTLYFDGQELLIGDLDYNQDSLITYIKNNMARTFGSGIVQNVAGYTTTPYVDKTTSVYKIKINPIIVYTSDGEVIISSTLLDNLTPNATTGKLSSSSGSFNPSTTYYIIARYVAVDDYATPEAYHPCVPRVPNASIKTRRVDSFEFYALTNPLSTDVILAKVTTDSGERVSTIDYSETDYLQLDGSKVVSTVTGLGITSYNIGDPLTYTEHANAIGTGTVTSKNIHGISADDLGLSIQDINSHQQYVHATGILTDDVNSTNSALYATVSTASLTNADTVTIYPLTLANREICLVDGITVSSTNIQSNTIFTFLNTLGSPIAAGYYLFYVDKTARAVARSSVFASEAAIATYIASTPTILPLWSIQWVANPVTGYPNNYDLVASTLRDWRIFGTTSTRSIRQETTAALASGLAVGSRTINFYNAKLSNSTTNSYFNASGMSFIVNVNGTPNTIVFTGTNPLSNTEIVSQLNTAITNSFIATAVSSDITLKAANTLVVGNGSANTLLGFTDGQADADDYLKEIDIAGDIPGTIDIAYDGTNIDSIIATFGNKTLTQELTYSGNYISGVTELIS